MRRALLPALVAGLLSAAACRAPAPAIPLPQPAVAPSAAAWSTTLVAVQGMVAAGSYLRADSALAAFADRHVGSPEGAEARYWRSLVQLDPANPIGSPRGALAAIDSYLAGGQGQERYLEALVLRRAASLLAGAPRVEPQLAEPATPRDSGSGDRVRVAEDSVRALLEELGRTQAELERIRRRLRPNPPPLALPAPAAPAPAAPAPAVPRGRVPLTEPFTAPLSRP